MTDLQRDALLAAGVDARLLYEDRASGAKDDRPGSGTGVRVPRRVLVVWKLDRLGRSLPHLLTIVNALTSGALFAPRRHVGWSQADVSPVEFKQSLEGCMTWTM